MFCPALAIAQTQPDALELLGKVGQTYTSVSQYEIRSVLTTTGKDAEINSMSVYLAFKSPDRYRLEVKATALAAGARALPRNEFLNVFDGLTLWNYFPRLNEYSTYVSRFPDGMRPQDVDLFIGVGSFRNLTGFFDKRGGREMRILREERLTTAGGSADCLVVKLTYPFSSDLFWIDKSNYHVLRKDEGDTRVVFETIRLNEKLPDELFEFKPPAGARKVER